MFFRYCASQVRYVQLMCFSLFSKEVPCITHFLSMNIHINCFLMLYNLEALLISRGKRLPGYDARMLMMKVKEGSLGVATLLISVTVLRFVVGCVIFPLKSGNLLGGASSEAHKERTSL